MLLIAQVEHLGSASDWSQAGGLPGLVIFALFVIIAFLMGSLLYWLTTVENRRQASIEQMIDDMRKERVEWQNIAKESTVAIQNSNAAVMNSNSLLERFGDDISDIKREIQQRRS